MGYQRSVQVAAPAVLYSCNVELRQSDDSRYTRGGPIDVTQNESVICFAFISIYQFFVCVCTFVGIPTFGIMYSTCPSARRLSRAAFYVQTLTFTLSRTLLHATRIEEATRTMQNQSGYNIRTNVRVERTRKKNTL